MPVHNIILRMEISFLPFPAHCYAGLHPGRVRSVSHPGTSARSPWSDSLASLPPNSFARRSCPDTALVSHHAHGLTLSPWSRHERGLPFARLPDMSVASLLISHLNFIAIVC